MDAADRLLGLIQQLYMAPGTIEGWHVFLDSLRMTMHGSGANLICHNLQSQKGTMVATVGYDPDGSACITSIDLPVIRGPIARSKPWSSKDR